MWIRSQNKMGLTKVNSLDVIDNKIEYGSWTLGVYESHERAMEVLDKIHQHINNYGYQDIIGCHEGCQRYLLCQKNKTHETHLSCD